MTPNDIVYLSSEGLEKLQKELTHRKTFLRQDITQRIASAKELGDLSENFEYHTAKDDQAQNESRIAQLEDMIRRSEIVAAKKGGAIGLGSTFTVSQDGTQKRFHMVGAAEANPLEGKISNESPLGKAFIGQGAGEAVEVDVPSGRVTCQILEVE